MLFLLFYNSRSWCRFFTNERPWKPLAIIVIPLAVIRNGNTTTSWLVRYHFQVVVGASIAPLVDFGHAVAFETNPGTFRLGRVREDYKDVKIDIDNLVNVA